MLTRFLAMQSDFAYACLRVVSGLLFAVHGMQKVLGVLPIPEMPTLPAFGSQMWFGGVIELVTGLAITFGVFTSWAAFLASGTMAVAYIQFHWQFRFDQNFFPAINHGEPALLYAFLFLFIACRGAAGASGRKPG
ncbi:MAG: DoxX family protein [Planctomycetes bacterium]|nr:DoxX family protein [Planctomycetota bacterium]